MKEQGYPPPENRSFFIILDRIAVILLIPELWTIGSGLLRCFQWGTFAWYPFCSKWMMLLFLCLDFTSLGLWLLFLMANVYALYCKTVCYLRRTYIYRRTNALLIQILSLICTAVTLIAMFDHARF